MLLLESTVFSVGIQVRLNLERIIGFEPTTFWLATRCSTNWATSALIWRLVGVSIPLPQQWQCCALPIELTSHIIWWRTFHPLVLLQVHPERLLHVWWTNGESNPDLCRARALCSRYHYQPINFLTWNYYIKSYDYCVVFWVKQIWCWPQDSNLQRDFSSGLQNRCFQPFSQVSIKLVLPLGLSPKIYLRDPADLLYRIQGGVPVLTTA